MNRDILFIYPPDRETITSPETPPLGMAHLASFARNKLGEDYRMSIWDFNLKRIDEDEFRKRLLNLEEEPDIIGIGGIVTVFRHFLWMSKICKEIFPKSLLISGGSLASTVPHLLFKHSPVDICVKGEGEETLIDIIKDRERGLLKEDMKHLPGTISWDAEAKTSIDNPPRPAIFNLDTVGLPAYDLLDVEGYGINGIKNLRSYVKDLPPQIFSRERLHMSIVTSRGCTNRCTFCYRQFPKIGMNSAEFVKRHIRYIHDKFGINVVTFIDELFNISPKRMNEMISCLREIKEEIPDFYFRIGGLRADSVTSEYMTALRDIGCFQVIYGLESGSQKMLNLMKKRVTVEQNRKAVIAAKEAGLHCVPQFIVGLPGESKETLKETFDFMNSIDFWSYISIHKANAYPGSELYQHTRDEGLIKDEFTYVSSLASTDIYPLQLADISLKEIERMLRMFVIEREARIVFKNNGIFKSPFIFLSLLVRKILHRLVKRPKKKASNLILFFETYSIIQTLFLFKYIKKARIIYFHRKGFPPIKVNPRIKKIVTKLIALFNKDVRIEFLPYERINNHNWVMNKKAIDVAEKMGHDMTNSASYKAVLRVIGNANISKCYYAQMVDDISTRLLFFKAAEGLIADSEERVSLVPADNDNCLIQNELFGKEALNSHVLPLVVLANRTRNLFRKFSIVTFFILMPSFYVISKFKKIDKKTGDIAMPAIWGFRKGSVIIDGVKCMQDDSYLYNGKIKKGQIIHIFKYWRPPKKIEEEYKDEMTKRDITYIDSRDYKMTLKLIKMAIKIQLALARSCLISAFYVFDKSDYIYYSAKVIYWSLEKHLELENVDYKVEFIKNDYSASSILSTVINSKYTKKTIGMQHNASPYDLPALSYVHFDKYIVYSDMLIKEFLPYWKGLDLVKTGRETIDWVVNFLNNSNAILKLKERFSRLYPVSQYIVVIAMSSDADYNPLNKWDEMYRALYDLKTLNDIDFRVFLRFRSIKYLSSSNNMIRFARLPQHDERIIIDQTNFSTQELMALCDLFIGCNTSFSLYEALATRAKVFTFNLHDRVKHVFGGHYGKDFILNTEEDIRRVFNGLKDNFREFDCDWEALKRDCNFNYDGRNIQRIQEAVWSLIK